MPAPAGKTNDDYWKRAVDALTGYTLPDRKTLFDDMKGSHDIPLMYVWVDRNIKVPGTGYLPGFASSGGWKREGADFIIPFYTMARHGDGLDHNKAHVHLIGAPVDEGGSTRYPAGGQFTRSGKWDSKHLEKSDGSHFTWDNSKFSQYTVGSARALAEIAGKEGSTRGFSHSGLSVDDTLAVHLPSFTDVALSFERVNRFLINQSKVLADWEKKDIGEGSAEWAGSAAGLFKHLVHRLNRNYEGYVDQLAPPGEGGNGNSLSLSGGHVFTTYPGRTLVDTADAYRDAARRLSQAWSKWHHLMGSPHRWLVDHLWDIYAQVLDNQMAFVDFETRGFTSYPVRTEAYKGYVEIDGRQMWLSEWDAWRAIGQLAVDRWQKSVDDALGEIAKEVLPALDRTLADAVDAFPQQLTDRDTSSLGDVSVKEANKKLLDEQKKRLQDLGGNNELSEQALAHQKKVQEDYEKDREAAKKAQEDARAQNEKDREEAKKYSDEIRKQNEQDAAEARKAQEDARKLGEQDRAEANAYAEEARKQNEQDRAAANLYAEEARRQSEQDRADAQALIPSPAVLGPAAGGLADGDRKKATEEARRQSEEAAAAAREYREQLREANDDDLEAARGLLGGTRAADPDSALSDLSDLSDLSAADNARLEAEHRRETLQAQLALDTAEHRADQQEQDARADYEQARADAQSSYEQARQEADRARADARAAYDNALARGEDPARAKEEYDRAVAEAGQRQQAARAEADRDLTQAREQYDRAMDDAAAARQEAREEYESRIAGIDGRHEELGLDRRTPQEIVRDKLSTMSEPYTAPLPAGAGTVYAPGLFDTDAFTSAGYGPDLPSGDVPAGTAEAIRAAAAAGDDTYGATVDEAYGALGQNASAAAGATAAGSGPGSGSGAMAPPMYPPMGGMGGGMGGGGQDQNGAGRQRNVLDSPIVRRPTRAGRAGDSRENAVPAARRVATSAQVPFAPPMSGGNERGQQTSSGRARTAWTAEEEHDDVWGTDEGGAPQALGR
ncbi:AAWKG family protein [Streptomyces sp. NPDC086080]|uniref:AAWKG family protein n=1 Tax=Streptomyces sp. NPDC086080 TaxID=3365748 RepID=UPI0037D6DEDB